MGGRQKSAAYHDEGIEGAFISARRGTYGGYSERRTMDSNDYPPDGVMPYKDFHAVNNSFRRTYQGEAKEWVIDKTVAFAERGKTVDQWEKYFENLIRSYAGKRASRKRKIDFLLMPGAFSSQTLNFLNSWAAGVENPEDLRVEHYWEYLATNLEWPDTLHSTKQLLHHGDYVAVRRPHHLHDGPSR